MEREGMEREGIEKDEGGGGRSQRMGDGIGNWMLLERSLEMSVLCDGKKD